MRDRGRGAESPAMPLLIGVRNCDSMVGMSWIWVRRFARAHGVPIWQVGKRKQLVPAAPLLAAIERAAAQAQPPRELTDEEMKEQISRELGLRLATDWERRNA